MCLFDILINFSMLPIMGSMSNLYTSCILPVMLFWTVNIILELTAAGQLWFSDVFSYNHHINNEGPFRVQGYKTFFQYKLRSYKGY